MPLDGTIPDKVSLALITVRQYIEKQGWATKTGRRPDGSVCITQAITDTYHEFLDDPWPMIERLAQAINANSEFSLTIQIKNWNDAPGRTVEDVLAILARAAFASHA